MISVENKIPEFLTGGGEMGERIRNFDWTETPLGPPEYWDHSLKTIVRIMLTSSQPIWIGWGKDLIKLYNDPYIAIVGGKHPWALGQPAAVVWSEIRRDIEPMLKQVMEENQGTYVESQLLIMERYGYPEETYYTFSYSPVPADNGGTGGMICYNTADTERIITERSLATLRELGSLAKKTSLNEVFLAAAKAIGYNNKDFPCAVIYKIDEQKRKAEAFAFSNIAPDHPELPAMIDILNPGIIGRHLSQAVQENKMVISETLNRWKDLPKGFWDVMPRQFIHVPLYGLNKNNPVAVLSAALNPYRKFDDAYKNFVQLVADQISLEVNNVMALEEERKRAEALAAIDKAKTLFFTNVSHEFRTPLTLMLGPIEEALKDPETTPQNLMRMDVSHRNAMRLLKLVNTLLDFSRIESGRQQATYALTDIVGYTKDLAANFRSVIEKAGLDFFVKADSSIQPVYLDRQMWEKIIFNLLSNAFKYTLDGSITVEVKAEKAIAKVIVKDTGSGIPSNELPHMFDRFHRVQNVTGRTFEGTGIGLSLTKELVQLQGGTISVESQVGLGTQFIITIPYGKDHLPASQIKAADEELEEVISEMFVDEAEMLLENGSSEKINNSRDDDEASPLVMIVDDNADMRKHLQTLLSSKFRTVLANNGRSALDQLKNVHPDLILSDVMMPEMDGIELLKEIKKNKQTAQIPVILLTARAGEELKIEGWETGADDYLVKPFSSREMVARISAQINLVKKRRAAEQHIHNLFMQAPTAIQIIRCPDFVYELMNEAALSVMNNVLQKNFTMQNVIGRTVEEIAPDAGGQGLIDLLKKVYDTGKPYIAHEYPLLHHRNGQTVETYSKFAYVPLRNEHGKITSIMVTGDDITPLVLARKKMEETNRDLEFAATISQSIADAVIGTAMPEREYVITSWNKGAESMYGWKAEEVLGKPVSEIISSTSKYDEEKNWQTLLNENGYWKGEVVQKTKDGKEITVLASIAYVKNDEGKILGAVAVNRDISEQKQAQERLIESEARFRFLFESNLFGVSYWKISGEIYDANDNMLNILGYTRKDLLEGKLSWRKFTLPEDAKLHEAKVQEALQGETVTPYETTCVTKSGKQITTLVGYAMLTNSKENGIAFLHDITKAKEAETELRIAKEQLEQTFQNIPAGVFLIDKTGKILFANDIAAKMSGYSSADEMIAVKDPAAISKQIIDLYEIFDEEGKAVPIEKTPAALALQTGKPQDDILEIRNKRTMTSYWVLAKASPLFGKDGNLSMVLDTSTDITIQKSAEKEIRQSEERFRTLAETLPQMVWMLNDKGRIEYGSKDWETYSGIKNVSDAWIAMVHPDDYKTIMSAWEENYKTGIPYRYEVRLKNKEGEFRWHYASGKPVKDDAGKITRWIGALTDIHVQKTFAEKLEQEVAQRTEELLKANKELESFNYIASHDLQEPLRKVQTFINLIKQKNISNEQREKYFAKIDDAAKRMATLIQSVLAYTRISNAEEQLREVDLNKILSDVKSDFELLIQEKKAIITADHLPPIRANALQMNQLFSNLISNALKFSKENPILIIKAETVTGDRLKSHGEADPEKKFVHLSFSDNGIGFDPAYKDQIFSLFQRLHNRNEYAGTGIGLSIVKKIVEQHYGYITAEGQINEGAVFHIWLPE